MIGKPSKLDWYYRRLRAMGPTEIAQRCIRRLLHSRNERLIAQSVDAECGQRRTNAYPAVQPGTLPAQYHDALLAETTAIRNGDWTLFGHLPVHVDMPPQWHHDPLVNRTADHTPRSSDLDHRDLPDGIDGRVIWELSRWSELTRLAQAHSELKDPSSGQLCIELLEDWTQHNPPLHGVNWTSPLEGAIRLINFAWMDSLFRDTLDEDLSGRWRSLRKSILPPHVRWLWLERSVGSSANNHLLGELVGLAVALCRWPELCKLSTNIEPLRDEISRQILLQFFADGGNREQALHYHWFALELSWHAHMAFESAIGEGLTAEALERLALATDFFVEIAETDEPWDYGDSDDAHVVPLFTRMQSKIPEFHAWAAGKSNAVSHWWPNSPAPHRAKSNQSKWRHFPHTGFSHFRDENWSLRFDHSPLGFEPMAAHGHLDALHLSIWYQGLAVVIDPGTGCYYHDAKIRDYLASWAAHNGPRFDTSADEISPPRFGPFLWGDSHAEPVRENNTGDNDVTASFQRSSGGVVRSVQKLNDNTWKITDRPVSTDVTFPLIVTWQFSPKWQVDFATEGMATFSLAREQISINMVVSRGKLSSKVDSSLPNASGNDLSGLCSDAFRSLRRSSSLTLRSNDFIETIFSTQS